MKTNTCTLCGNVFSDAQKRKFCSQKCYHGWVKTSGINPGAFKTGHKAWKTGRVAIISRCRVCGEQILDDCMRVVCSSACRNENRKRETRKKDYRATFMSRVQVADGCWLWSGRILPDSGYGALGYHGHQITAHRLSWILHNGPIPDDLVVCHRCDNPPCVNPKHLFLGTYQDNTRDCVQKGRHRVRPSRIPMATIREIRERHEKSGERVSVLAREYGISVQYTRALTQYKHRVEGVAS